MTAETFLHLISTRAQWLVPVLCIGFLGGEFLARYSGINSLAARFHRAIATLARKLNRPKRSTAVRVYRGIVGLIIILVPTVLLGLLLARPVPGFDLLTLFILAALYGRAFATFHLLSLWQRARSAALPLELPGGYFLFADTHAVIRYTILENSERFAIVVGTSFWYLLGGLPMAFIYLATATTYQQDRTPAYGWAASALFHLLDCLPRLLANIFLILAALFTPGARPFAIFRTRSWRGTVAYLLNIALGGITPDGTLPWIGTGTPKLEANHLLRWLIMRTAATIFLALARRTRMDQPIEVISIIGRFSFRPSYASAA